MSDVPLVFAERVSLAKDHETGERLGYAFVCYRSQTDAVRAVEKMNRYRYAFQLLKCVADWSCLWCLQQRLLTGAVVDASLTLLFCGTDIVVRLRLPALVAIAFMVDG